MKILPAIKKSVFFNKLLFTFLKGSLNRNRKFKDLHLGDTCYIFGNGESIKSMDLAIFNDKVSIGCNNLFLHKDFNKLDCRYYQIVAPFIFLPYFKYYGKLQRNDISAVYKKKIKDFKNVTFFTSILNKFTIFAPNIYYEHHFGVTTSDLKNCELDGTFSFLSGATDAMIGLAIYMGFKKAVLVGVDYTFSESVSHHFYEKGKGRGKNNEAYNKAFFEDIKTTIDVLTITLNGSKSDTLEFANYTDYTKNPERYQENIECIDKEDLDKLDNMGLYKIW